ncbi:MAG TPA: hypothetical protein VFO90_01625 [Terrimicrobiaceae bacterium]|nr:hypothetical protein [Terrimicrobiaceae bacterium]
MRAFHILTRSKQAFQTGLAIRLRDRWDRGLFALRLMASPKVEHGRKEVELAAAVARHLVKVEPENAAWWINLAYATRRRCESVEKAEAILIQARRSDTTSTLPVCSLTRRPPFMPLPGRSLFQ